MQRTTFLRVSAGIAALVGLALGWWAIAPRGAESEAQGDGVATVQRATRPPSVPPEPDRADADAEVSPKPVTEAAIKADERAGRRAMAEPQHRLGPSVRPFDSPQQAAAFVEARVVEVFSAVAPEIDPASINRDCSPDGRRCTFVGPWPGDDLFGRWVGAISAGKTSTEALQGVRFANIDKIGEGPGAEFELIAHAP